MGGGDGIDGWLKGVSRDVNCQLVSVSSGLGLLRCCFVRAVIAPELPFGSVGSQRPLSNWNGLRGGRTRSRVPRPRPSTPHCYASTARSTPLRLTDLLRNVWRRAAIRYRSSRRVVEVAQAGRSRFATKDWSTVDDGRARLLFQANAGWFLTLGRSRILVYQSSSAPHSAGTVNFTIDAKTRPPMTVMSAIEKASPATNGCFFRTSLK